MPRFKPTRMCPRLGKMQHLPSLPPSLKRNNNDVAIFAQIPSQQLSTHMPCQSNTLHRKCTGKIHRTGSNTSTNRLQLCRRDGHSSLRWVGNSRPAAAPISFCQPSRCQCRGPVCCVRRCIFATAVCALQTFTHSPWRRCGTMLRVVAWWPSSHAFPPTPPLRRIRCWAAPTVCPPCQCRPTCTQWGELEPQDMTAPNLASSGLEDG